MRFSRSSIRAYRTIASVSLFLFVLLYFLVNTTSVIKLHKFFSRDESLPIEKGYPFATNYDRKDWHDWKFIEYEKSREGPGEQGKPVELTEPKDIERNAQLFEVEGLFVIVSDKISVNRSVPDTRNSKCAELKYLKTLPLTSIIVIFHNEHTSILLRTIHSIYNRTPQELTREILLVNDASTKPELYEPLQKYVRENFDERVKIVNLKERRGLIVTRMEGARRAVGEVLVFLDSHIEVNVNWLPPLLEPIAIDPKTSTVPLIDNFQSDSFEYTGNGPSRGVFDWMFLYRWLPPRPEDWLYPERPAPLPVMLGCAFAIRKDYFFDLGGYDEQLQIWNGENYELSFKLWLCGGKLLEIPCSRVAHTFRQHNEYRKLEGVDFVTRNFKRIAEVWLDDYKKLLYATEPEKFAAADAGDLTEAKAIKANLHCKPFHYFLEFVMPDMLYRYPTENPGVFARGRIQSEAFKRFCVDTFASLDGEPIGMYECEPNATEPTEVQHFTLTWHRNIRLNDKDDNCLDIHRISILPCHYEHGNQYWFYNLTSHQISSLRDGCLTALPRSRSLSLTDCNDNNINQKWLWGYTNKTALTNWKTFGAKLPQSVSHS